MPWCEVQEKPPPRLNESGTKRKAADFQRHELGERAKSENPPRRRCSLLLEMVLLRELGAGVALRRGTAVEHAQQLR